MFHLCESVFIRGLLLQQPADEFGEFAAEAFVLNGVPADDGGAAEAKEFNGVRAGQGGSTLAHGLGGAAFRTIEFRRFELVELPAHVRAWR